MDRVRANSMLKELLSCEVGGWLITDLKGFGKSAAVFIGTKDGNEAAVKVFDPELIERFGHENQLERINRELKLVAHTNQHLINIIDGGKCSETSHLFIVMELHDWPSLDEVVNDVPRDKIWLLMDYVSDAAKYLESSGLVHRDIKPSNIIVSPDFSDARLLDLGVLRPIGDSDLTDSEEKAFIGTLRYSAPEWLLREEDDSIEGWQAVTFYQIGAVLHDVIMKKRLFEEFSDPYARLVHAVDTQIPNIEAGSADPELILLAKNCLTKDPSLRRQLVTWESFKQQPEDTSETFKLKHRITQRQKAAAITEKDIKTDKDARINNNKVSELLNTIGSAIRNVRTAAEYLPPCKQKFNAQPDECVGELQLIFGRSVRYAIPKDFTVYLKVNVINPIEDVVQIAYAKWFDTERDDDALKDINLNIIYEGVLEEDVFKEKIENVFLIVVDEIQQLEIK